MSLDRFTDRPTAVATDRVAKDLAGAITRWGEPVEVYLPIAGDEAQVEHGLGELPHGVLVILSIGGNVRSSSPHLWTPTSARLVADANAVRAVVIFITCRKDVPNA